jgi:hypothetical protein
MKLLFDENLSFKLCRQLSDLFPASTHVRLIGLERADDRAIWDYARVNEFALVTLDVDFVEMAGLLRPRQRSSGSGAATSRRRWSRRSCETTPLSSPNLKAVIPPVWKSIDDSNSRLSIPIHGNRPLKIGLLRHLAKLAELSDDELE